VKLIVRRLAGADWDGLASRATVRRLFEFFVRKGRPTMPDRRKFVLGVTTAVGAMTLDASEIVQAAAQPTMSLNVLYPNHDGARFDMRYYRDSHIPLATKVMKADRVILIEGVPMGDSNAPYTMIAHFEFASPEALKAALENPDMAKVRADVATFTDIKPTVLIGKS
jgi:uncharacterized protein (TIGR02118 family)